MFLLYLLGVFALVNKVCSTCTDLTRVSEAYGTDVVLTCVQLVQNVGVFDDFGLLRKIAIVETADGESAFTYAPGEHFRGGIWGVAKEAFDSTKSALTSAYNQFLVDEFQIDWTSVEWDDLRKPLFSALAARLYLRLNRDDEPLNSDETQLKLWQLLTGQQRMDRYFTDVPNAITSMNTENVVFGSYVTERSISSTEPLNIETNIDNPDDVIEIELSVVNGNATLYVSNLIASSVALHCGVIVEDGRILLRPSEMFQYGMNNKLYISVYTEIGAMVDVAIRSPRSTGDVSFESNAETFVVGMFSNHPNAGSLPIKLLITTMETEPVEISIESIFGQIVVLTMTSPSTEVIIPSTYVVSSADDTQKGFFVKTKAGKKISVSVSSSYEYSTDVYHALPGIDYVGIDEYVYYAITPNTNTTDLKNRLLLIGNYNSTSVDIFPTEDVIIRNQLVAAGESTSIKLNLLETLLIESELPLTGTKVVTNKPITFLSGHQCAVVPTESGDSCDFAIEQFPPTITWGKKFMFQMLSSRTGGSHFTVLTSSSNNFVSLWCTLSSTNQTLEHNFTLETAGSYKSLEIAPDDVICSLVTTEPSVLTVLGTSENTDENSGDPLLMMIPPVEQFTTTTAYKNNENTNNTYINLAVMGDYSDLLMDNSPLLLSYEWDEVYAPGVDSDDAYGFVTQFSVDDSSVHHFTTTGLNTTFSVVIYGFGFSVGYGQRTGMMLKPINHLFTSFDLPTLSISDNVLRCSARARPGYTIAWEKAGVGLISPSSKYSIVSTDYDSILTIAEPNPDDSGLYTCTIDTYYPYTVYESLSVSQDVNISAPPLPPIIPAPVITSSQEEYGGQEQDNVTIDVSVTNGDDGIISWQFEDLNGFLLDIANSTDPSKYVLSETSLMLQIMNLRIGEHGVVAIAIRTDSGTALVKIQLTVYVAVALQEVTENSHAVDVGDNVTISCFADGIKSPVFTWRKSEKLLLNSDKYLINTQRNVNGFRQIAGIQGTMTNMIIKELEEEDEGTYSCIATNEAKISTKADFTVNVIDKVPTNYCSPDPCNGNGVCTNLSTTYLCTCNERFDGKNCQTDVQFFIAPQITNPPSNLRVSLYDTTRLVCVGTGVPAPVVKWFKDGETVANAHSNQSEFIFESVNLADRGIYYCEVHSIDNNGETYMEKSDKVVVNIKNIVQYEGYINMSSANSITSSSFITEVNNELSGIAVDGSTYFLIEQIEKPTTQATDSFLVPVLLTVLIEDDSNVSQLLATVIQQIQVISEQSQLLLEANLVLDTSDRFDGCQSSITTIPPSSSGTSNLTITIEWAETDIGETAYTVCPCGDISSETNLVVSRYCSGDFINGGEWEEGDTAVCDLSSLSRELCQLTQLEVDERIDRLDDLTRDTQQLGATEVIISVLVLVNTTDIILQNDTLIDQFLNVADNILNVNQSIFQVSAIKSNTSARLQESILAIADGLPLMNDSNSTIITRSTFAVGIQRHDFENFNGQSFSINETLSDYDIQYDRMDGDDVTASITLPSNLFDQREIIKSRSLISNAAFLNLNAFLVRDIGYREVGSLVVSARIVEYGSMAFKNLTSPIRLRFEIQTTNENASNPQCVFFDTKADDGFGEWSSEGCYSVGSIDGNIIECQCDHLTSFSILLDISPDAVNNNMSHSGHPLTAITFIGLCVSIVCLIITIISYVSSKKLRNLETSQLLVNLCAALLGLYIMFIAAIYSMPNVGLCSFVAAALHYFFLVAFMTMAVEAVSLYINLIVVLGRTIHRFVIKGVIVSWIIPFFIVVFSFGPNYKNYASDHFCRAFGVPYYVGMLAPFLVIYIFNWIIFAITFASLAKTAFRRRKVDDLTDQPIHTFVRKQLIRAVILSSLLGVGWGIGLFASQSLHSNSVSRDIISGVFVLVTAFHGILILIMHCLRSKDVLFLWKQWFYGIIRREISNNTTTGTFDLSSKKKMKEKKFKKKFAKPDGILIIENSSYESSLKFSRGISDQPDDILMVENSDFQSSLKFSRGISDPADDSTLLRQVTMHKKNAETQFSSVYGDQHNNDYEIVVSAGSSQENSQSPPA